jgi:hypothetical protein
MDEKSLEAVDAKLEELENSLLSMNDALFQLVGILSRIIVEGGLVSKDELAAMIESKAGREGYEGYLPTLVAFSRAVRMNLPGGRFDVIEGGVPNEKPA